MTDLIIYNRFDPAKNFERHLFHPDRVLQSAELNELQSHMRTRVKDIADVLFREGDIIRGAACIVDASTGAATLESVHQQYPHNAFVEMGIDIARHHHERWDGSGYPDRLAGEAIPLSARIMALVDVYDALTSDRPYRASWSKEQALAYIRSEAGRHFDPTVVDIFLKELSE